MRHLLFCAVCVLAVFGAGCAHQIPATEIAALSAEFHETPVVVDNDCIFSAPTTGKYAAYRIFGLCMFSDTRLRLYYGGDKPSLAFSWPVTAIKSWAFHTDTFTLVTEAGNFGMVLKDPAAFIAVLRAHGVPENGELPLFRAKDPSPFDWM